MNIIIAIFILGIVAFIFVGMKKKVLAYVSSGFLISLVLIYVLAIYLPRDFVNSLPFCNVDDSELVEVDSGTIFLSSGTSAMTVSSFYFDDNTNLSELEDYLSSTNKNVYLQIKRGSNTVYSKNLGRLNSSNAEEILDEVETYLQSLDKTKKGYLPRDKVKIRILFFFIEL